MRIKELLLEILNHEESEEAKLDILTDIGLGTTNEEVFKATEDAREIICNEKSASKKMERNNKRRNILLPIKKGVHVCNREGEE